MSLETSVSLKTVPQWSETGSNGASLDDWRMWRHTFVGLAGAKGVYALMHQNYRVPTAPTASEQGSGEGSASELRARTQEAKDFAKKNQDLWCLLAQATKGAAAMVVMRFEEPVPDGRNAWLEWSESTAVRQKTSKQHNCCSSR